MGAGAADLRPSGAEGHDALPAPGSEYDMPTFCFATDDDAADVCRALNGAMKHDQNVLWRRASDADCRTVHELSADQGLSASPGNKQEG